MALWLAVWEIVCRTAGPAGMYACGARTIPTSSLLVSAGHSVSPSGEQVWSAMSSPGIPLALVVGSGQHACCPQPKRLIHRISRLLLHVRHDMAVDAERHRHMRVAQHLTHHLGIDVAPQQQCCRCVPQIVEADARQPSSLQKRIVLVFYHADTIYGLAYGVRKHQVHIFPHWPQDQPFFGLAWPVVVQCLRPHI